MDSMMNATHRARTYRQLGLQVPEDAARLLQVVEATQAALYADPLAGIDYDKLTPASVAKALREAALTRAVRTGMRELAVDVQSQLGRRINAAFAADLDRAIDELRPGFLKAAAVVVEAIDKGLTRDIYGDGRKVLDAGAGAAALFHRTRDALAELTAILAFVRTGRAHGYDVATVITLAGEAHADTLDGAQQILSGVGGDDRWLELYALPGVAPALNTVEEAEAVVSAAADRRRADQEEKKRAAIEAAQQREAAWLRMAGANR